MNVAMPLSISAGSGHSAGEQYGCDCALKDETKLPKYKILREKGASDSSLIPNNTLHLGSIAHACKMVVLVEKQQSLHPLVCILWLQLRSIQSPDHRCR